MLTGFVCVGLASLLLFGVWTDMARHGMAWPGGIGATQIWALGLKLRQEGPSQVRSMIVMVQQRGKGKGK